LTGTAEATNGLQRLLMCAETVRMPSSSGEALTACSQPAHAEPHGGPIKGALLALSADKATRACAELRVTGCAESVCMPSPSRSMQIPPTIGSVEFLRNGRNFEPTHWQVTST
jgi:hypothetical protein